MACVYCIYKRRATSPEEDLATDKAMSSRNFNTLFYIQVYMFEIVSDGQLPGECKKRWKITIPNQQGGQYLEHFMALLAKFLNSSRSELVIVWKWMARLVVFCKAQYLYLVLRILFNCQQSALTLLLHFICCLYMNILIENSRLSLISVIWSQSWLIRSYFTIIPSGILSLNYNLQIKYGLKNHFISINKLKVI